MKSYLIWVKLLKIFGIKWMIKYLNSEPMKYESNTVHKNDSVIDGKVVVYTAIFGDIDGLLEPDYINEKIDYYVITDQTVRKDTKWKLYQNNNALQLLEGMNSKDKNRFCKFFPNLFFPQYTYSIYIDGNMQIVGDLYKTVEATIPNQIGLFCHPYRDDIYLEAIAILKLQNSTKEEILEQINFYKKEGFPEKYGLFENNFIVREHNNAECISIMEAWWEQYIKFSKRDQMGLMYVLWKLHYDRTYIKPLGVNVRESGYVKVYNHQHK